MLELPEFDHGYEGGDEKNIKEEPV